MAKKYFLKGTFVEVSDEVYAYLKKSDRKIRYFEEDLKVERYIIDSEKAKVTIIPSREDSIDRMMEFGADFQSESDDFRAKLTNKVLVDQASTKLNDKERYLIVQLFYFCRTERDLAKELGIPQRTLHDYKQRILCKLHKILE